MRTVSCLSIEAYNEWPLDVHALSWSADQCWHLLFSSAGQLSPFIQAHMKWNELREGPIESLVFNVSVCCLTCCVMFVIFWCSTAPALPTTPTVDFTGHYSENADSVCCTPCDYFQFWLLRSCIINSLIWCRNTTIAQQTPPPKRWTIGTIWTGKHGTPPLAVTETPFYYRQLIVDKVDTRNNSFGILFIIYKSYIIELYMYQRNTIIFCKTTDVDIGYQQSRDKYMHTSDLFIFQALFLQLWFKQPVEPKFTIVTTEFQLISFIPLENLLFPEKDSVQDWGVVINKTMPVTVQSHLLSTCICLHITTLPGSFNFDISCMMHFPFLHTSNKGARHLLVWI